MRINTGRPMQNSNIQRFNQTHRDEALDLYLFRTLGEVRDIIDHWITKYNEERPHDALQGMTSVEYLEAQIMQKTLETYGPNYGTYKICPGNKRTG